MIFFVYLVFIYLFLLQVVYGPCRLFQSGEVEMLGTGSGG